MPEEQEIRELCGRLIACDDEAEIRALADRLRWLLHQSIEEARDQVGLLPLIQKKARGKTAA